MYIATVPNRKSPPAILLRESYRQNGKVKTRTIANLTHWAPERIEALRKALKGEFDGRDGEEVSGEIFGVLFALKQLADQVGMTRVLGCYLADYFTASFPNFFGLPGRRFLGL
jgi:hypothetical protein